MQKIIDEWLKIAEYDLKTAEAMLETGRYLYVAFMCQQSIEKVLKAIYAQKKNTLPPRTHNLLYLVDVLALVICESDKVFLSELNQFYLESRYPDKQGDLAKELDQKKAQIFLDRTKEVFLCLKQMLQ